MKSKVTGTKAAHNASQVLANSSTGKNSKTAAASALAQVAAPKSVTSSAAASSASQVLRDGRTSAASKSAAGSALSQRQTSQKK